MTTMARFSSTCPDCGERWQPGDLIRAQAIPPGESPIWKHATCPDPELAIDFDNPGPSDTDLERHTPLAEQIAREHAPAQRGPWLICACDRGHGVREHYSRMQHAEHIATVTERAVRERVAEGIEAIRGNHPVRRAVLGEAARIARGATDD